MRLFTFQCDEDGWSLQENDVFPYPTFFHISDPVAASTITLKGDFVITFIGIGDDGKRH